MSSDNKAEGGLAQLVPKFFQKLTDNGSTFGQAYQKWKAGKLTTREDAYVNYANSVVSSERNTVSDNQGSSLHPSYPDQNPMGECTLNNISLPPMNNDSPDSSQFDLMHVQIIQRHGARSTCGLLPWETKESFANDWKMCHSFSQEMDDPDIGVCEPGQLTVSGERMCHELGKKFRERYINKFGFLNDDQDFNEVHVESTTYDRARLSLKRMLQGFFPKKEFSDEFIDNATDPQSTMVPRAASCANLSRQYKRNQCKCDEIDNNPKYAFAKAALAKATGVDHLEEKNTTWVPVGDWASSRLFHGLPLFPELEATSFLHTAEDAAWGRFKTILASSASDIQLGIGPLLERILGHMEYNVTGKAPPHLDPHNPASPNSANMENFPSSGKYSQFQPIPPKPSKLVVYSGHDTTLAPLTSALGIPLVSWPPYSSHIEIELWRNKDVAKGMSGTIREHSVRHLITPAHKVNAVAEAIDSTSLPHVDSTHDQHNFRDAHWVRVVFNDTVVYTVPLATFQERLKMFKAGDAHNRKYLCGEFDDPNKVHPNFYG